MKINSLRDKWSNSTRLERTIAWLLLIFAAYTLIGFLLLPAVAKPILQKKLSKALHRQVTLEKIKFNPYRLTIELQGLNVVNSKNRHTLAGFDNLLANMQIASLFRFALILREVKLLNPSIDIIRYDKSSYNFSDILEAYTGQKAPQNNTAPEKGLLFSINNISITGGNITFDDRPKSTVHRIEDISIAIPFISNLAYTLDEYVQPTFKARVNDSSIDLGGRSQPFSGSRPSDISFELVDVNLVDYLPYLPMDMPLTLQSGFMGFAAYLKLQVPKALKPDIELSGVLSLSNIDIVDKQGRSYAKVPKCTLNIAPSKILEGTFIFNAIEIEDPAIYVNRSQEGRFLPLALFSRQGAVEEPRDDKSKKTESGLDLTVKKATVTNGGVVFEDNSVGKGARITLDNIQIACANLATKNGRQGNLSISGLINQQGQFSTDGAISLVPLKTDLAFNLGKLALPVLQPYVAEKFNIVLAKGLFDGTGKFAFSNDGTDTQQMGLNADFKLADLSIHNALSGTSFFDLHELDLQGVSVTSQPVSIHLNKVVLDGCKADIKINQAGKLNLALLGKTEAADDLKKGRGDKEGEEIRKTQIGIDAVQLKNGLITFTDYSIKPKFSARLSDLKGNIASLSTDKDAHTKVAISGNYDGHAPMVIKGEINPFIKETFAEIGVDIKNIELSPFSPYTGKYIGYKTEKGKLLLDLSYRLNGKELTADNKLLLDQFTLGDSVDSPDASNLPVQLAIALLKDRNGKINLDIPVSGNLDDPEFSVGGVVFQFIFNLIAKAATSPFALLGALLPSGEDYRHLSFEPGSSVITKDRTAKLDSLAKMLFDRPGLKMDVIGSADYRADADALHQSKFDKLIKLAKYNYMREKGEVSESIETLQVEKEEFAKYLELAYKVATFKKPRNFLGFEKALPDAEMEKRLRENIIVTTEDFRLLALSRADTVRDYLVEKGPVEPDRLYVIEPEISADDQVTKEGAGKAEVEMIIK